MAVNITDTALAEVEILKLKTKFSTTMNSTSTALSEIESMKLGVDAFFLMICGSVIFFMHLGFAMLEVGAMRSKNATNIVMKSVLDLAFGALIYYICGYAFAYGTEANSFIGYSNFALSDLDMSAYSLPKLADWFFQFTFALAACSIVSGALAERANVWVYVAHSVMIVGFVYPVITHWAWDDNGWLAGGAGTGLSFQDFAGSCVVHVTGGTAAFIGAAILGPRKGRFNDDGTVNEIPGHNLIISALGGFILFFGFLAFNGGSIKAISNVHDGAIAVLSVTNTVISGSSGLVSSFLIYKAVTGEWAASTAVNGGLAGMVSICAGCNDLHPYFAIVIGTIAGAALIAWHYLLIKLKVDDPLDATPVHLGGGLTGITLTPIFATNGIKHNGHYVGGIVFGGNRVAFAGLGWNLIGTMTIMVWTAIFSFTLFKVCDVMECFRVTESEEENGLDTEVAYNIPMRNYKTYEQLKN